MQEMLVSQNLKEIPMNGSPLKGKIFFVCLSTFEFKNQAIRHSALENIKGVV